MKIFAVLTIFTLAAFSHLGAEACVFGDNDYCVKCPGRAGTKVNSCPGGEVGMIAVGVANPGCGVSYYYPACETTAAIPQSMNSKAANAKQHAKNNLVAPGRANIKKDGNEVVIRMKKADFEKLIEVR